MPIPAPESDESQEDFISRCMGSDAMQEYEDKQRAAICYDAWSGKSASAGLRLLSQRDFHKRARLGIDRLKDVPSVGVYRFQVAEPKAVAGKERTVRFCFSDSSVDRMQDTIDAKGWDLHAFNKNPVALWAHDSSSLPVGRASNVLIEGTRLMGDIEFADVATYAFADTVYKLLLAKFLNAVSVGFLPLDYDWADDDEARGWGIDFKRQELLEISVVPVPANSNALAEARSKGIDTRPLVEWAERTLEGGGRVILPRAELERLRKAAKEPAMPRQRKTPVKADGEDEGNPAAGGAFVGNCGRPADKECGMKNVAECSIHGQGEVGVDNNDDEAKRLDALIAKAVSKALGPAVQIAIDMALKAAAKPKRRAADDDDDKDGDEGGDRPDFSEDHEKSFRAAHMHMKAMSSALDIAGDHFDNAMENMDTIKEALDAEPPKDDGEGPKDDPEAEKAARIRKAQDRREKLAAV